MDHSVSIRTPACDEPYISGLSLMHVAQRISAFATIEDVSDKFTLPLIAEPSVSVVSWEGMTLVGDMPRASEDRPEPDAPQGAYNRTEPEMALSVPLVAAAKATHDVELLAPAGGLDAAFAAFHFGADAIYLGLKKFSARAEAENF